MTLPAAKPVEPCRYTVEQMRRREAGETETDRTLNAVARAAERHEREGRPTPDLLTVADRRAAAQDYREMAAALERD